MEGADLPSAFRHHLERWALTPDGAPIVTATSRLLPVRRRGAAAMLKVAIIDEERTGNLLMRWWDGQGAARVLAQADDAILLERAEGGCSLADLARGRQDDAASRIICAVLAQLHAPRARPAPPLVPLTTWFGALEPAAGAEAGILRLAAATASRLLATQQDIVVLHGDMHHGNVLDFGAHGWLAIDPKGLIGDRCFDYANMLCNPDHEIATKPGRLARQVAVVAAAAQLERSRLLAWIIAWAGLSAAFARDDGLPGNGILAVAELAAAELEL
jgi:streptomycin 6-kinase